MLLRDGFNLRCGQSGEVRLLRRDHSRGCLRMVVLQIFGEIVNGAARSSGVADKNNLARGRKVLGDLLVERTLLGHALAAIMRFLAMDQMVLKSVGIVGRDLGFGHGNAAAVVLIEMRAVMVDNYDNASGRVGDRRGFVVPGVVAQEAAQAADFFDIEIVRVRALEQLPLRADDKRGGGEWASQKYDTAWRPWVVSIAQSIHKFCAEAG